MDEVMTNALAAILEIIQQTSRGFTARQSFGELLRERLEVVDITDSAATNLRKHAERIGLIKVTGTGKLTITQGPFDWHKLNDAARQAVILKILQGAGGRFYVGHRAGKTLENLGIWLGTLPASPGYSAFLEEVGATLTELEEKKFLVRHMVGTQLMGIHTPAKGAQNIGSVGVSAAPVPAATNHNEGTARTARAFTLTAATRPFILVTAVQQILFYLGEHSGRMAADDERSLIAQIVEIVGCTSAQSRMVLDNLCSKEVVQYKKEGGVITEIRIVLDEEDPDENAVAAGESMRESASSGPPVSLATGSPRHLVGKTTRQPADYDSVVAFVWEQPSHRVIENGVSVIQQIAAGLGWLPRRAAVAIDDAIGKGKLLRKKGVRPDVLAGVFVNFLPAFTFAPLSPSASAISRTASASNHNSGREFGNDGQVGTRSSAPLVAKAPLG